MPGSPQAPARSIVVRPFRRTLNRLASIAYVSLACTSGEVKASDEPTLRRSAALVQTLEGLLDGPVVRRVDPALAKLLKDLPLRDPDEHELAEVWMAHSKGKAVVPIGIETEIELGPWRGPTMRLADVELNARNLSTGEECTCRFGEVGEVPIWHGIYVRLTVLVE